MKHPQRSAPNQQTRFALLMGLAAAGGVLFSLTPAPASVASALMSIRAGGSVASVAASKHRPTKALTKAPPAKAAAAAKAPETHPSAVASRPGGSTGGSPSGFVTRQGTKLYLDGAPYRFVGLNIYNANSRKVSTCWYTLNEGDRLSRTLDGLAGQNVFRADFYQGLALTNGVRDWSAFDKTLAVAAAHNMKVSVSLSGEGGTCKDYPTDTHKLEPWYQQGYKLPEASGESYRDWVQEIVTRYKDNPAILLWAPLGEAEDPINWGSTHTCSSTANATLKAWADDVTGLIKSIDRNHLTTVGTIGSGQCGASGNAYTDLYSGPNIDLCEREDYGHPSDAMPGDRWNGMQVRLDECAGLNKPLFVGEAGIRASEVAGSLATRSADFAAKFSAQFAAGVVGELIWDWRDSQQGGSSLHGYEVGPGDPVLDVFKAW